MEQDLLVTIVNYRYYTCLVLPDCVRSLCILQLPQPTSVHSEYHYEIERQHASLLVTTMVVPSRQCMAFPKSHAWHFGLLSSCIVLAALQLTSL
jgi:hypothetical protein